MNINRHNYEEFFLLYVDGELSAPERKLVELFVQENADLANELQMFEQTKLPTETMLFADKSTLYKTDTGLVNLNNYEENFLLYIDDELTGTEKKEVEKFVLHHPQLQQEFLLLQETKLQPETIVFANKASLYKKEKDRVVYFTWQRLSVAAAFIAFTVLVWNIFSTNKSSNNNIAVVNNPLPAAKKIQQVTDAATQHQEVAPSNTIAVTNNKDVASVTKINAGVKQDATQATQKTIVHPIENNQSLINENAKQEPVIASTINPKNNIGSDVINVAPNQTKTITASTDANTKSLVQNTVYKELDTDDDTKNNKLYIGNMGINKDKVRGLLKRASHVFDKSSDDEKNLNIASFAVNTRSMK